ncbi:MAG: hypothetical protein HGA31_02575 [Candidatus Moranbacteria bacterium]|nr:hypothetical protein [Candidatus Moranbacteria bacterium]
MKNEYTECQVGQGLTLSFEDLWAEVEVSVGEAGIVLMEIDGNEKLLEDIGVTQNGSNQIRIKGKGLKGGVTVVSRGGRSISITGSGGNVVISGGKVICGGNNLVIINGKVISGGAKAEVIEGGIPKIIVKAPKGTDLEVFDVEQFEAVDLGGRLSAEVSGQKNLRADGVNGMKVKCSGQSECRVRNASGNATLTTSGQSTIDVQGNLNDVEADSSGQSEIRITGDCHDFNGESGGQSEIRVTGRPTGSVRRREGGQSEICVGK